MVEASLAVQNGDTPKAQALAFAVRLLLLAIPALWLLVYFIPPINHDAGSILRVCARWLAGETLYRDIIDVQTPIVYLIYSVPVMLGGLLHLHVSTMLVLCFICAIGGSFMGFVRTLQNAVTDSAPFSSVILPPMALYLMAMFPLAMFGQREHLMLIAGLPYLALAAARSEGRKASKLLAVGIAVFAAVGFAQKPHFLAIPGHRRALRDPVPWVLLAVLLAHGLFAWFATPEYFTTTLPLIFKAYIAIGNQSWWQILAAPRVAPTAVVAVLLGSLAFAAFGSMARVTALFVAGGLAAAIVQAKGWDYHMLPAMGGTFLLAAILFSETLDR